MYEQDLEQENEFENDNFDEDQDNHEEEGRDDQDPNEEGGEQGDQEEFDIVVGDEKPAEESDPYRGQQAPEWVKQTREENRNYKKRIHELERQLEQHAKPETITLGEKPTLESAGYDAEEFEKQLFEWTANKAKVEQQEAAQREEQEKAAKVWQDKLNGYEAKKTAIKAKVRDFDEAEEIARDVLTPTQQGILLHGAEKPELLVYHLGKNPQKAKELASITDPIQFAFAAAKIDAQIKMTARKPSTSPERKPSGSASYSGTTDTTLAKLQADADRTGDSSKVVAYIRNQRNK